MSIKDFQSTRGGKAKMLLGVAEMANFAVLGGPGSMFNELVVSPGGAS